MWFSQIPEIIKITGVNVVSKKNLRRKSKKLSKLESIKKIEFWYGGLNLNKELFIERLDRVYRDYLKDDLDKFVEEYWKYH